MVISKHSITDHSIRILASQTLARTQHIEVPSPHHRSTLHELQEFSPEREQLRFRLDPLSSFFPLPTQNLAPRIKRPVPPSSAAFIPSKRNSPLALLSYINDALAPGTPLLRVCTRPAVQQLLALAICSCWVNVALAELPFHGIKYCLSIIQISRGSILHSA